MQDGGSEVPGFRGSGGERYAATDRSRRFVVRFSPGSRREPRNPGTPEPRNLLVQIPNLEPHEARDGDVLAEFGDGRLQQLRDGRLRITNRGLVEQAHLFEKAAELAVDDLVDDVGRFTRALH